ncbi:hypothetical protein D3C80_1555360 [compost metagenome]
MFLLCAAYVTNRPYRVLTSNKTAPTLPLTAHVLPATAPQSIRTHMILPPTAKILMRTAKISSA